MATINKEIAEQIIANNGYYEDDPRVRRVVRYDNLWGNQSWAIIYPGEDPLKYHRALARSNVQTLWDSYDADSRILPATSEPI